MSLPAEGRHLLVEGSAQELAGGLEGLLGLAVQTVPSCVGVSLTVRRNDLPVTVTALAPGTARGSVRSSLTVRLPVGGGAAEPVLRLYASLDGAFDPTAAQLWGLLHLDPGRVVVDRPPELPDPVTTSDELSTVDRALGVLLDRGLLPDEARAELDLRAAAGDVDVPTAARDVLAGVRPGARTRRPPT